ncbi:hypothetical protein DIPPA_20538 [Diplonema papillatum]|nr:hypothetical protein DIPPA_20532 [Diplonema papillatum]KAJ9452000.1 hypothetical protein DIPPA_20538 [Diplonema papillatum]
MARVAAAVAAALCVLPAEARLARLKDLGPFELGKTVHAAGEPGVGHKTVDEFVCNGFNCHHMKLDGATCTHDPAALEESLDFVWTCEEHVAGDRTPRIARQRLCVLHLHAFWLQHTRFTGVTPAYAL